MTPHPKGIGQTIGHGAKGDNPIVTERLAGESLEAWLARHEKAVITASEE